MNEIANVVLFLLILGEVFFINFSVRQQYKFKIDSIKRINISDVDIV